MGESACSWKWVFGQPLHLSVPWHCWKGQTGRHVHWKGLIIDLLVYLVCESFKHMFIFVGGGGCWLIPPPPPKWCCTFLYPVRSKTTNLSLCDFRAPQSQWTCKLFPFLMMHSCQMKKETFFPEVTIPQAVQKVFFLSGNFDTMTYWA